MKTKNESRKKFYDWEKILKGSANHRRLEVLFILHEHKDISTDGLVEILSINYQTGAHHIQKLVRAGLVSTRRQGSNLLHNLSPYGQLIINLLIKL